MSDWSYFTQSYFTQGRGVRRGIWHEKAQEGQKFSLK